MSIFKSSLNNFYGPKEIPGELPYDILKEKLIRYGKLNRLPISVEFDTVGGGLFSNGKKCIVIRNNEKKFGYYYYVITTDKNEKYNRNYISCYTGGHSNTEKRYPSYTYINRSKDDDQTIFEDLVIGIIVYAINDTIDIMEGKKTYVSSAPSEQEKSTNNTVSRQYSTVNNQSRNASRPKNSMPRNIYEGITINSRQARTGCEHIIFLKHSNKRLSVTIPAGIKSGNVLRLKGQGVAGGHLFLTVEIK